MIIIYYNEYSDVNLISQNINKYIIYNTAKINLSHKIQFTKF